MKKVLKMQDFTVVLQKTKSVNINSFQVMVRAGSAFDKISGIAHLLEHCVLNSDHKKKPTIMTQMSMIPGALNACTGREKTIYYCDAMSDQIVKKSKMLFNCVLNPSFTKEDFMQEKNIVNNEVSMYNDQPDEVVDDTIFLKSMGRSFGNPIAGTLSSLSKISFEDLHSFHKSYYHPKNMVIIVSGPEEISELKAKAEEIIVSTKINNQSAQDRKSFKKKRLSFKPVFLYKHLKSSQSYISLLFDMGQPHNMLDVLKVKVLSICLAYGDGSILFDKVRSDEGLCYSITASPCVYKSRLMISINCNTSKMIEAFEAIKEGIKSKITKENFHKSIEHIKYQLNKNSVNSLAASFEISESIHVTGKSLIGTDIINLLHQLNKEDVDKMLESLPQQKYSVVIGGNRASKKAFTAHFG